MIELTGITKKFRVYASHRDRLKEWLSLGQKTLHSEHQALKNVSLSIEKGEVFGLVGMNGAGKSTLLKIITGTMAPSSGVISLQGRVAALLELGTGFHPELSGRENVAINGKIMGLSKAEVSERMEEIRSFSELKDYFDKPLRTYSSGMYVRLAFSLATSVHPDILIIDEALSVGDAYFQQKCIRRMQDYKKKGTTILFVSHDLAVLKYFCDRVALLDGGKISCIGTAREILERYNARLAEHSHDTAKTAASLNHSPSSEAPTDQHGKAQIKKITMTNLEGLVNTAFEAGSPCLIGIEVSFADDLLDPTVGILIRDRLGYDIFGTNSQQLLQPTGSFKKGEQVLFTFQSDLSLGPGEYTLTVAVHQEGTHIGECHQWIDRALSFKIIPRSDFQFIGVALVKTKVMVDRLDK